MLNGKDDHMVNKNDHRTSLGYSYARNENCSFKRIFGDHFKKAYIFISTAFVTIDEWDNLLLETYVGFNRIGIKCGVCDWRDATTLPHFNRRTKKLFISRGMWNHDVIKFTDKEWTIIKHSEPLKNSNSGIK